MPLAKTEQIKLFDGCFKNCLTCNKFYEDSCNKEFEPVKEENILESIDTKKINDKDLIDLEILFLVYLLKKYGGQIYE